MVAAHGNKHPRPATNRVDALLKEAVVQEGAVVRLRLEGEVARELHVQQPAQHRLRLRRPPQEEPHRRRQERQAHRREALRLEVVDDGLQDVRRVLDLVAVLANEVQQRRLGVRLAAATGSTKEGEARRLVGPRRCARRRPSGPYHVDEAQARLEPGQNLASELWESHDQLCADERAGERGAREL